RTGGILRSARSIELQQAASDYKHDHPHHDYTNDYNTNPNNNFGVGWK
uniref:Uncharacterized protein n=1 Tax=Plectus sambesii TaxID=2011161 RepID=A0A914UY32_9BILA